MYLIGENYTIPPYENGKSVKRRIQKFSKDGIALIFLSILSLYYKWKNNTVVIHYFILVMGVQTQWTIPP